MMSKTNTDSLALTLKANTTLVGAKSVHGVAITVTEEDFDGQLWIYSNDPYGSITMIVRADGFERAYGVAIDASPTIPVEDLPAAYGFSGDDAAKQFAAAGERSRARGDDYPDLVGGYQPQNNASGTGIVAVGDSESLVMMTRGHARGRIALQIEADDD